MKTDINLVMIKNVYPELNCGNYYVKRIVGDIFNVEADIFTHGHDVIKARVLYRKPGGKEWNESEMEHIDNDRWGGEFYLEENTFYEYTIFAWRDQFLSWVGDTFKKYINGQDISSELLEGKGYIEEASTRAKGEDKKRLNEIISIFNSDVGSNGKKKESKDVLENIIFGEELALIMEDNADRSNCSRYEKILKVFVNRKEAEFSSWYEMWPRSQGKMQGKSATFKDMENRLKEIKKMGFNVVYLPPIHPIGETNRKGPNNSLLCPPGSPGCPYAIGNKKGGHTAIEPSLGTMDDFISFEKACNKMGMEVALDFAIQASPDHPWVKKHPEWFSHRPDGSIKYAENPPKKYEDIYPINFDTEDKEGLWNESLNIIKFWIGKGVKIFRVDNPHSKPIFFWEWLIEEVHKTDPDVIFLSEAFTKPKMMKELAQIGFTQSYTYFTWRNFKHELVDYFNELINTDVVEYMVGNLFTNTPDILPQMLQNAPRSAFKIRAALAGTLSSVWGMYNGFELCEGKPIPGKEEYMNSEKYEYKVWDWNRSGNIKDFITKLNEVRNKELPLQKYRKIKFYNSDNENIICFGKYTEDYQNVIIVVINLDPYHVQSSFIYLPVKEFRINNDDTYQVHDLLTDEKFYWQGEKNFIELDPEKEPVHIFKLIRLTHKEQEFDYFY